MTKEEAGKLGYKKSSRKIFEVNRSKHLRAKSEYEINPKKCGYCGCVLSFEERRHRYCSHSCASKATAIKNGHTIHEKRNTCLYCGRLLSLSKAGKKFCSNTCQAAKRIEDTTNRIIEYAEATGCFPSIKTGQERGEVRRAQIRRVLEKLYGRKCSICGIETWNGNPITFIVDHKDGNPFNCEVSNYRLVCPNCDSQLPTFKGRNRGNDRKWRNKNT